MAFAFVVRWWYFDVARAAEERHIRSRRQEARFQLWQYAHLPLFLGIAVVGVGFERLISPEGEHHLARAEGWILCSAAALLGIALAAIGATSGLARSRVAAQIATAMAALALGTVAADLNRVVIVITLLTLCCAQTLLGRGMQPARP
jgi:low temperature requirement protein LtrA